MKSVTMLLATLLATSLHAVAADTNKDACVAECRTQLLQQSEKDCAYWRGELPRPDLYNHCQHGHTQGREASCKLLCGSDGQKHDRRLDSQRLDACEEFRGRPPSERVSACNDGFVQARSLAHEVVKTRKHTQAHEPAQPIKANEPVVANKPDTQEAKRDDVETKRKLTLNSPVSPKSLLEAAREEAAAAFQDAKATEL